MNTINNKINNKINNTNNIEMEMLSKANENEAFFSDFDLTGFEDRELFVHNLGWLLSQTRKGIVSTELTKDEIVIVKYKNGFTKCVNVNLDDYFAIILDVMANI